MKIIIISLIILFCIFMLFKWMSNQEDQCWRHAGVCYCECFSNNLNLSWLDTYGQKKEYKTNFIQ